MHTTQAFGSKTAERWFYLFVVIHFLAWTIVPALTRINLPLDSIEGILWGHQLEWGYDKNPFLNGWLSALAVFLDGQSGILVYAFSQLSVIACVWAVWRLAKNILHPTNALLAVMLLEGIQYFNLHAIDFNDNTLELSTWALCMLSLYGVLRMENRAYKQRICLWLATGFFAALGMMAKYYTAALLAAMFLFILSDKNGRAQLKTLPPYLGLALFCAIILPHVIWLFSHDFVTITYVFERTNSQPYWANHFYYPLEFAWQQFETFLPAFIIGFMLWLCTKTANTQRPVRLSNYNKKFLLLVGAGPFLLTLILSLITGIKLRAGWGMPLQSLWTIILLAILRPEPNRQQSYFFIGGMYCLTALLLFGYHISITNSNSASSANFPGREIADKITKEWHERYHTPLTYVAGSRWIGGNIGFYSKDHPSVFISWETRRSPWINLDDLNTKGSVFVWNISENEDMPKSVRQQFGHLQQPVVMSFDWKRNTHHLPPTKVGVAFLPPAKV